MDLRGFVVARSVMSEASSQTPKEYKKSKKSAKKSSMDSTSSSEGMKTRICLTCGFKISAKDYDLHTTCLSVHCRGKLCSLTDRCDICREWSNDLMKKYLSHQHRLKQQRESRARSQSRKRENLLQNENAGPSVSSDVLSVAGSSTPMNESMSEPQPHSRSVSPSSFLHNDNSQDWEFFRKEFSDMREILLNLMWFLA